jgi:twitching motility two-component system response regulator PilH
LPGLQALGQIKPDLIVLDLHMQGVNGIEICRYIRRDPRLADVPVLAISSDNQEIMIAAVREAGANAFLNKPITIEALESALKQTQPPPTQPFKKDPNALAQTRPHKG